MSKIFWLLILLMLAGCSTTPPTHTANACELFAEEEDWYEELKESEQKWGVPMPVQLAILRQESGFRHNARPPRGKLLGFIPWFRPSSAYGYAQAKDETWDWYKDKNNRWFADRTDFADAVDFIGWYVDVSHKMLGIPKEDAFGNYLAYHEGHGGYRQKTFKDKPWLITVARKVEQSAATYRQQLTTCQANLESGFSLWPS